MSKYQKEIEFLTKQISELTIDDDSQNPATIKIYNQNNNFLKKLIVFQEKYRGFSYSQEINNLIKSVVLNFKNKEKNKYLVASKDKLVFCELIYVLRPNLFDFKGFYTVDFKNVLNQNIENSITNLQKLIEEIKQLNTKEKVIVILENFNNLNLSNEKIIKLLNKELNNISKNIVIFFSTYTDLTNENQFIPFIDEIIDFNNLPKEDLINWFLTYIYKLANGYKFTEKNWYKVEEIVKNVKNLPYPNKMLVLINDCLNQLKSIENLTKTKYENSFIRLLKKSLN